MYKLVVKDVITLEVFEYEINDIKEMRDILKPFENKNIWVELHRIEKGLKRVKENK